MKSVAPTVSPFLVLRPREVREEVISDYAGVQRIYEFDLTRAAGVRGGTLFAHLRHTIAVAEVDGVIFADTGEAAARHIGRTPGNYWLTLSLGPEDAGKTLRVTLTPVYNSVRGLEPDFLVMDRQTLLHTEVLPKEGPMLLLGSVTAAMGFFLMLLALSLGLEARDWRRVFYLGAVSCAAGVWKLCGLSALPLLLDWYGRAKLIWYAGAAAYLLLLVFSLRFLTVMRDRENDRVGRLSCCLASVSMLCESDPERAGEVVANFNHYLQSNFTAIAATEPVEFVAELEHTRAYLNVQQALYASKLTVEYAPDYVTFRLPPLTLQPIVENSVKHGIGKTHREERIFIRTRALDSGAEVTVEDDGTSYEPSADGAVHVGLDNIRQRLALMCGGTLDAAPTPAAARWCGCSCRRGRRTPLGVRKARAEIENAAQAP